MKIFAIIILSTCFSFIYAQNLNVNQKTGGQISYALSDVRKLTFPSGRITITKTNNSADNYNVADLSYLNFTEVNTGISQPQVENGQVFSIYPNPATKQIYISLSKNATSGKISIRNILGKTVINKQVGMEPVLILDVCQLAKGVYVCCYDDGKIIRALKFTKD